MERTSKIEASAAVLIGGKSRRLGIDKANLMISGEKISALIYEKLARIFSEVFFVGSKPDQIEINGKTNYVDAVDGKGPIGGLLTALENCEYNYCFLTACDFPFLSTQLIEILWDRRNAADIIIPEWNGKIEPLTAFYNKLCIASINNSISKNKYALRDLGKSVSMKKINMLSFFSVSELTKIFLNINTPGEYERALKMM